MKKMIYTKELDEQIISHEDHMLALYLEKIKEYKPLFEENGVSLKTGLMWSCFPNDTAGFQRTPFQNGYQCYVYCTVLKDGKEVQISGCPHMETLVRLEVRIMDLGCIYVYLGIAVLSFLTFKNLAVGQIEEIGISSRYYPKHYIKPKRWIRNIFHIKKHKIPRYLYFELLLSLFFLALGPLNIVICVAVDGENFVSGMLVMFHSCLIIVNVIFIAIMTLLYFKRK